jgi:hypothetical protein
VTAVLRFAAIAKRKNPELLRSAACHKSGTQFFDEGLVGQTTDITNGSLD